MKKPKIKLVKVTKTFTTRWQKIVAVKEVDLEVMPGDFVVLVGPSGCGKSTIIRMIIDIIKPTSGKILIDGEEIGEKRISRETVKKMGFIFQQPNLFPWLTVKKNIQLPLQVFKLKGNKWENNLDRLIKMAGLEDCVNSYPTNISGSKMQKAGVIRAMVHDPEILLMDEPFAELDELSREQLDLDLLNIWEKTGKTIIFITHNVEEAVLLASKVYIMETNPGRIVSELCIELDRPRTLDMITEEKFINYEKKIINLIGKVDLDNIK